jgi:collagenase-like PrtC family protease
LNGTCLGNKEWTIRGQRSVSGLLDWISELGVESVTVSLPYLLQLIKKRYPHLKVYVSTQACVSSLQEAEYWQDLGADRITLSVHKANRDFELLAAVGKRIKSEIQLIANLNCLRNCPFALYHGVISSHNSQTKGYGNTFAVDYPFLMCNYFRIKEPAEFIRSGWIRPEDTALYEDLGIFRFKIVSRTMSTDTLLNIIEAYSDRHYDGNLLDLFSDPRKSEMFKKPRLLHAFRHFFHPFLANPFRLKELAGLAGPDGIHIDNRSLDGFLKGLLKAGNCNSRSCLECGYCSQAARQAITIRDEKSRATLIERYEKFLECIIGGDMFKYA